MRRFRFLTAMMLGVLTLALGWIPYAAPLHAQDDAPINTTPPRLLLTVILDEGGSMQNSSGNSANSNFVTGKIYNTMAHTTSDPNAVRRDAVVQLLDILHSDYQQHRFAVMTFDRDTANWITGDLANPYVTVGGSQRDEAIYTETKNRIETAPSGLFSSDTANALSTALQSLQIETSQPGAENLKPVVLLITDDVPMDLNGQPFPVNTVWGDVLSENVWRDHITTDYEPQLAAIKALNDYEGAYCAQPDGGGTMAVIGLTTANWVTRDGQISPPNSNTLQAADDGYLALDGEGLFFSDLAIENNWLNPNGKPLYYPVDPLFQDFQLTDFHRQINRFVADVRCTPLQPPANVDERTGEVTFTLSNSFTNVRFFIERPNDNQPFTLVNAAGEAVPLETSPIRAISYREGRRWLLTLDRNDWPEASWNGDWSFSAGGTEVGDVFLQAEIDLRQLRWEEVSRPEKMDEAFQYQLMVADRLLTDRLVITETFVSAQQQDRAVDPNDIEITRQDALYQFLMSDPPFLPGYNYLIDVGVTLNKAYLPNLERITTINGDDVDLLVNTTTVNPIIRFPANDVEWCVDRSGANEIPLAQQVFQVSIEGQEGINENERNSLYSYTTAYLSYPDDTENGTPPTLDTILTWNPEQQLFVGYLDCTRLQSGTRQDIDIVIQFPGDLRRLPLTFSFLPTPTPIPTPVPIMTEAPPVPTPSWPTPTEVAGEVITQNPFTWLLLWAVGIFVAVFIVIRSVIFYRRRITPMQFIWLENQHTGQRKRALNRPALLRWLPLRQRRDVNGQFEFLANGQGEITVWVKGRDVMIDGQPMPANKEYKQTKREIVIRTSESSYKIINRHPLNRSNG